MTFWDSIIEYFASAAFFDLGRSFLSSVFGAILGIFGIDTGTP